MSVGPVLPTIPTAGLAAVNAATGGAFLSSSAHTLDQGNAQLATEGVAATGSVKLADLVAHAAATQDGLSGLFADLVSAQTSPQLPPAVATAIRSLRANQSPLSAALTPELLKSAMTDSGLFLEARLAAGDPNLPQLAAHDLKAQLVQLLSVIMSEIETDGAILPGPPTARRPTDRPPPPLRGSRLDGQPPVPSLLDGGTDRTSVLNVLKRDVRAALSRLELSQLASVHKDGQSLQWRVELPIAAPGGVAIAQLEVRRDAAEDHGKGDIAPTWRTRFAIDVTPSGPIHAEVGITGDVVRVTLWAESEAAQSALNADLSDLKQALSVDGAAEVAVRILPGSPAPAPAAASGAFVDRRT